MLTTRDAKEHDEYNERKEFLIKKAKKTDREYIDNLRLTILYILIKINKKEPESKDMIEWLEALAEEREKTGDDLDFKVGLKSILLNQTNEKLTVYEFIKNCKKEEE